MMEDISVENLLDLVRIFSVNYRNSEAFRLTLNYYIEVCGQEKQIKKVLYKELCESLGEDIADIEIENKLSL